MSELECTICSTRDERVEQSIYEIDDWRASLSANQGYLGTLFIELLDHRESLSDLTDSQWLHWHLRPRYDRSVEVLGQHFVDPNFAHHYDRQHMAHVGPEVKDRIAGRLREAVAAG